MPLHISLWIIFVGLLTLIFFLEPWFLSHFFTDPSRQLSAAFITLAITKLIIFPWQMVGLLRCSDNDYLKNGNTIKSRLIQLLMVFAIGFNLSTAVDSIQAATFKIKQQEIADDYKQFLLDRDKNYKISLRNNLTQLVITGELDIGITTAVKGILKQRPHISTVALNSIGGHVYEGRGLSKLFTRQSLDTYVYRECSSACTTAFSGGAKRYIGSHGKLGFHQYKLDLNINKKAVNFHNPNEEQERDLDVFKSRGIKDHFLKKIFKESSNQMWFPSHEELLEANFIDGVIETN